MSSQLKLILRHRLFFMQVSFQDDELLEETSNNNQNNAIKELPPLLRRNSITPLSTRPRQTRPPTAPLNSLFFKDLQQQKQR